MPQRQLGPQTFRCAHPAGAPDRLPALSSGMAKPGLVATPPAQLPDRHAFRALRIRRAGICRARTLFDVARARHADRNARRAALNGFADPAAVQHLHAAALRASGETSILGATLEALMGRLKYAILAGAALAVVVGVTQYSTIQAQAPSALTGQVSSAAEGAMEGVLVSAKKVDSNITVTVVSDKSGRYTFPANRLDAGQYTLRIR